MTPYTDALEAFNRASFDPPTPGIELAPAETIQADEPDPSPTITLRFAVGLAVLATALIGAHVVWVAAGMPGL